MVAIFLGSVDNLIPSFILFLLWFVWLTRGNVEMKLPLWSESNPPKFIMVEREKVLDFGPIPFSFQSA
jgi:hypothetical protein